MPRSRRWSRADVARIGSPGGRKRALTRSGKPAGKFDLSLHFPGIPGLVTEYRFHPTRKWRFDVALPHLKVAIEQEGGVWTHGRHTRGAGFLADCEKYNEAAVLGWRVLRFTPQQIRDGTALATLKRLAG